MLNLTFSEVAMGMVGVRGDVREVKDTGMTPRVTSDPPAEEDTRNFPIHRDQSLGDITGGHLVQILFYIRVSSLRFRFI